MSLLSQDKLKKLYDLYEVYWSPGFNCWMREQTNSGKKSKFELGVITKFITGENILTKGESYVNTNEETVEGLSTCLCGCNKCSGLYKIYCTKTNDAFLVGSMCVEKAGHENFCADLQCAKRNGRCSYCKVPLRFNGPRANSKKTYNKVCNNCRSEVVIYLKISFAEKDYYKAEYGVKWNQQLVRWYWKGYEDEWIKEDDELKSKFWYKVDDFPSYL
jgi:hypothetical protein